jgi:hypothetical protein
VTVAVAVVVVVVVVGVVVVVVVGVVGVVVVVVVVVGPCETFSWTVEPFGAAPPAGLCETTVSAAWLAGTSVDATVKPFASSAALASARGLPTSLGTGTWALPLETLIRTFVPGAVRVPAAGSCATTVPTG